MGKKKRIRDRRVAIDLPLEGLLNYNSENVLVNVLVNVNDIF